MRPLWWPCFIGAMESARKATADDLAALVDLGQRARQEMVEKRGGDTLDRLDPFRLDVAGEMRQALADAQRLVVLGCYEDTPVAYGLVRVYTAADQQLQATIEAIFVEPEARSVGVGESVVNELIAWSESRGAVAIDALALPGDRMTKNFFESQKMVARAIVVQRSLI